MDFIITISKEKVSLAPGFRRLKTCFSNIQIVQGGGDILKPLGCNMDVSGGSGAAVPRQGLNIPDIFALPEKPQGTEKETGGGFLGPNVSCCSIEDSNASV